MPRTIPKTTTKQSSKLAKPATKRAAKRGVTAEDFRRIALSLPETEERAHMSHPDFRVRGKVFSTLHYPDKEWGMVKLSLEMQAAFVGEDPSAFRPCNGAWGLKGCTNVRLAAVPPAALEEALLHAWRSALPAKMR
jgi:hypothetical protein